MLVRLTVKRMFNPSTDYTLISSNLYSVDETSPNDASFYDFTTQKIEQCNLVTNTPSSNYEYQIVGNKIYFYTDTAYITSSPLFITKFIYITGEKYRTCYSDPYNLTGDIVEWLPLLEKYPTVSYDSSNIFNGILSCSSSNITCLNPNNFWNKYLGNIGAEYSFNCQPVKIWICIDSVDNILPIFEGYLTSFNLDEYSIIFNIEDSFSKLNVMAKFNEERKYTYNNLEDYPNLYPNSNNTINRIFFGHISNYGLTPDTSISTLDTAKKVDVSTLPESYCYDYTPTISITTNRDWTIGRCQYNDDETLSLLNDTIFGVDNSDPNFTYLEIYTGNFWKQKGSGEYVIHNALTIGDVLKIDTRYVRVLKMQDILISPTPPIHKTKIWTTKDAGIADGQTATNQGLLVVIDDGTNQYYCADTRDYAITLTTTLAGFLQATIKFTDNFEANHAGMATLDPSVHKVMFRIRPLPSYIFSQTQIVYANDLLKFLIESAGLLASTANLIPYARPIFCIPSMEESEYSNYSKYIQDILQSTSGIMFVDSDLKLSATSYFTDSGYTITDSDIIKDSLSIEVNYSDITTRAIIYNGTIPVDDVRLSYMGNSACNGIIDYSTFAELNSVYNVDKKISVVDNYLFFNILSNKFNKYRFRLPSRYFDLMVGKYLIYNYDRQLGDISSSVLYIIGIEYSTSYIEITATNMEF
jgi:hypothetical protein